MQSADFKVLRKKFGKTQEQMAMLLGLSVKAIHSYEQGWRKIPGHVERQMIFLISRINHQSHNSEPCWVTNDCEEDKKKQCPAWEFNSGDYCWLVNGTICQGEAHKTWDEKIELCKKCKVFKALLRPDKKST